MNQLKKEIDNLERTIRILRTNSTVALDKKEELEEKLSMLLIAENLNKEIKTN